MAVAALSPEIDIQQKRIARCTDYEAMLNVFKHFLFDYVTPQNTGNAYELSVVARNAVHDTETGYRSPKVRMVVSAPITYLGSGQTYAEYLAKLPSAGGRNPGENLQRCPATQHLGGIIIKTIVIPSKQSFKLGRTHDFYRPQLLDPTHCMTLEDDVWLEKTLPIADRVLASLEQAAANAKLNPDLQSNVIRLPGRLPRPL